MTILKNIQPLSAETIYDLLKKEFPTYINDKLGSDLAIDFAHVYDLINVIFPEVIEGTAMTLTVTTDEISISANANDSDYNSTLLEQHLVDFVKLKAE